MLKLFSLLYKIVIIMLASQFLDWMLLAPISKHLGLLPGEARTILLLSVMFVCHMALVYRWVTFGSVAKLATVLMVAVLFAAMFGLAPYVEGRGGFLAASFWPTAAAAVGYTLFLLLYLAHRFAAGMRTRRIQRALSRAGYDTIPMQNPPFWALPPNAIKAAQGASLAPANPGDNIIKFSDYKQ